MGYTTDFHGGFTVSPPLEARHRAYLLAFANTRRVRRDADKAQLLPDPIRDAVGLPIGLDGAYFVGAGGFKGQDSDDSVLDHNDPPGSPAMPPAADPTNPIADWGPRYATHLQHRNEARKLGVAQPGLWCQWIPNDDGTAIVWDEGEKFYEYISWIEYLIEHFLAPWGYALNGVVSWHGENSSDHGEIHILDNIIRVR